MSARRRLLLVALGCVVAFAAGFGAATVLLGDHAATGARAQARLYEQVLADLQAHYYKPVNVAHLGRSGINALLASLHDPYTQYFTPKQARLFDQELQGRYSGIGAQLTKKGRLLTVARVFPGSPAAQGGLRPGDVVVSVNGRPTTSEPIATIAARLQGAAGTRVRLELRRAGVARPIDLTLTRRQIAIPLVSSRLLVERRVRVGYVRLSAFAAGAGRQVRQAVSRLTARGAAYLILDLRDNGGGLVQEAADLVGDFLPAGKVVATTQGLHSPKHVLRTGAGSAPTGLPLVVLVNGNTASSAEIATGALQDDRRATVIGTRTFGKGVIQEVLPLPGGGGLRITVAAYRTPDGRDINHKGIEPSIVVSQKSSGGGDKALARALQFIAAKH